MLAVGLEIQWDIKGYVYMVLSLMSLQKAHVKQVSDAENLSVCLVSEEEIFCWLNPSDKTDVNKSVTQTLI